MIAGVIQTARHSPSATSSARRTGATPSCARWPTPPTSAPRRTSAHRAGGRDRGIDAEGACAMDYIGQAMQEWRADLATRNRPVDIYTTLDLHTNASPKMPCATGSRRWIHPRAPAQASPRRPSSPSIRVAATSSRSSAAGPTTSRNTTAPCRRGASPGRCSSRSSISPFERAAEESRRTSPASLVWDEPTEFSFEDQIYRPGNYENE